jgi:alpha-beta hydrolase superfamily lysophospholipase
MADLSRPEAFKKISSALPIYIFSGDQDPVGQQGIGVAALLNVFTASGQRNITKKMYLGGRHEMLNEINKKEVYEDLKNWLLSL